jgi:hypothetical protein
MPFDRPLRNPKPFSYFAIAKSNKKAQFDHIRFHGIFRSQLVQGRVHRQHPLVIVRGRDFDCLYVNTLLATPMPDACAAPCPLNKDPTHRFSGGGEEMCACLPGRLPVPPQSQPGFMDQSCGLERLPGLLLGHFLGGDPAQLPVNQRQEFVRRLHSPSLDCFQDVGQLAH